MSKEKILIVDDEKSMRDFLKIMLAKEGYEVKSFSRGEAAIKHFKDNQVDLVISDIRMKGMDGVELLKELKGDRRRSPCSDDYRIRLCGYRDRRDEVRRV